MLVLPGSSSISAAKRTALLAALQRTNPAITAIDAVWVHLVQPASPAAHTTLAQSTTGDDEGPGAALGRLLAYGDDVALEGTRERVRAAIAGGGEGAGVVVFVLPRPGSVSPWSSKATDIAALCNLGAHVTRLERGAAYVLTTTTTTSTPIDERALAGIAPLLHDRMTQCIQLTPPSAAAIFAHAAPRPLRTISLSGGDPRAQLAAANTALGLALAPDEIAYLAAAYAGAARGPSDAELFMFAQVNSEHCRHKIFNAAWTIDGVPQPHSLFGMIRNTEKVSPTGTLSAYSDNAAVLEGSRAPRFGVVSGEVKSGPNPGIRNLWGAVEEDMPILIKVETHNHPTAVSPYPGASTGSGGEIRDEGAVGRGSQPKAGLAGFTVSNLLIPGYEQPWETDFGRPGHIASALEIMLEGPLGASAFNNEFGRPALTGYFRTFAESVAVEEGEGGEREVRGYHKPIMIAGGYGNVRPQFATKTGIRAGARIVVLGGPGLLIGLGGGAASSQASGAGSAELDFASVQRDNAEMQRRCQQVINACVALDGENPIESIHDVGAGGLSNALPELVHDSDLGARFEIRDVLVADASMSPMEIWCNESQERYVLAISADKLGVFEGIAARERCPFSVVGEATEAQELVVTDRLFGEDVIRLKMSTLFGKPPKMSRSDTTRVLPRIPFDPTLSKYLPSGASVSDAFAAAVDRVFRLPSVGSKSFLITIGDRSITGLVTRDQMVGPWQVPVADVAVTRSSYGFDVLSGEAMAMGERTPVALLDPAAAARMAIAESLLNLNAAAFSDLARVKLSANWMCDASKEGEGAALYAAVHAVGMELCPALGVGIPVGKDSMSMSMKWTDDDDKKHQVSAPLSLIVTAFSPVDDVRATWTPQLLTSADAGGPTALVFFDLAAGKKRLGGSALAQVFNDLGAPSDAPDVESPAVLRAFLQGCRAARRAAPGLVLAYHDRSDGGMFATVAEMCFAGRVGATLDMTYLGSGAVGSPLEALFNEELGAVVQVRASALAQLLAVFVNHGFPADCVRVVGSVNDDAGEAGQAIRVVHAGAELFSMHRAELQAVWAGTSYQMQLLRDDPACAHEEHALIASPTHTGLFYDLTFAPSPSPPRPLFRRPKVAVLREQGVNGHAEMAWAFAAAGFDAVDVHMSDLMSGAAALDASFRGLAACGGFSYGDVLGAGRGWAHSALLNARARGQFAAFFARADTFALAVCNGCQFVSGMRALVPGARGWPEFRANRGERFEGRVCVVEVPRGGATARSPFLRDMAGSRLPVVVAHGEGRAVFPAGHALADVEAEAGEMVAVRYVDSGGAVARVYPLNPNGSEGGVAGVQTRDGRVLAMMPHPERVVALESNSWVSAEVRERWGGEGRGEGPWFRMFRSARVWCG